ncbi:toll/interleukin-1 receptor domain-containing protein [Flavobacterium sp. LC2016-01]|uniref:TIR domain-containing protein n=1 Tax=Flavobacterium sp. LC2016-01 TaxID=2675876 RepID=UPI0012BA658B|nr:toll/interleukin-1 receptor domain-containing protein [Flavobacterium sp. LC2016-01]MTH14772.1 TIR domain-containing protein [Flavobacterium sp. LC2016-01]
MSLINISQLRGYQKSTKSYTLTLKESLRNFRNESKFLKTKIFLSHKHDELENLEGAISFLNSQSIQIYIDWLDEGMPKTTCGNTAIRIKEKIKENDKFILLATEGAINSKWCNWELGLGDAAKYINNIAILPVKNDYSDFSGSEYLEIYPYIYEIESYQYFKGDFRNKGVYVIFPAVNGTNKFMILKDWLQSK